MVWPKSKELNMASEKVNCLSSELQKVLFDDKDLWPGKENAFFRLMKIDLNSQI